MGEGSSSDGRLKRATFGWVARRLSAVLVASLVVAAAPASADTAASPSLRQLAKGLNAAGSPGAVVLVRDSNGVRAGAAGYANLRTKERMRADHAFRVGSITKTFVATVVLQLTAEGTFGLDDSIERWLPGLVPNGQAITLRQLLNHTSGIYNYTDDQAFFNSLARKPATCADSRRARRCRDEARSELRSRPELVIFEHGLHLARACDREGDSDTA